MQKKLYRLLIRAQVIKFFFNRRKDESQYLYQSLEKRMNYK